MTLTAKVAVPFPAFGRIHLSTMERVEKHTISLFCAPPEFILTDSIAAGLYNRKWPVAWCRFAFEDGDPGILLLSLIEALQQLAPEIGSGTIRRMRQQPGPVNGWPQLFASLASEASGLLPVPCALVFENAHFLDMQCSTFEQFNTYFLSQLPEETHSILTTATLPQSAAIPAHAAVFFEKDLRLDAYSGQRFIAEQLPDLSTISTARLVQLAQGQAAGVVGFITAARLFGIERLEQLLKKANSAEDLLTQIVRAYLLPQSSAAVEALAVCQQLEYTDARMMQSIFAGSDPADGPWWQSLEDGWKYLRSAWRQPLQLALRSAAPGQAALSRAAEFYLTHKAPEKAVPLYIEIGELSKAASVMDMIADRMMDLGQWDLLRIWINRLPAPILHQWPWLVYAASEMVASQGDIKTARRAFGKTISLFKDHEQLPGICQSLLAESALAVRDSDWDAALGSAEEALSWAEKGILHWYIIWASWAIGYLHLKSDNFDLAKLCFLKANEAAMTLASPDAIQLTQMMAALVTTKQSLSEDREKHRLIYLELDGKEAAVSNQIQYLLEDTPEYVSGLLETCGWSNIPLTLKLPAQADLQLKLSSPTPIAGLKVLLQGILGSLFRLPRQDKKVEVELVSPMDSLLAVANERTPSILGPKQPPTDASLSITVYLLGPFRTIVQETAVQHWPKGRGRSLFAYLLAHRSRSTPREVLMELFWPDASPDIARNRLNVALYGLRKSIDVKGDHPLILFKDGAYQLNPAIGYWVDVDEFNAQYQDAARCDMEHKFEDAIAAYEACINLYQGDYLEDEPYAEWPVLTREKLRISYLSILDRLSEIYLNQEQYNRCVDLCQRILERDNCREDAYCRLMRCYANQEQIPLAIRQYQVCVETLRTELEVEPSPVTQQIYERLLRRKAQRVPASN
jgi:DNA-binding SARP family transcriptional activator